MAIPQLSSAQLESAREAATQARRARFIFGEDVPWTRDGEAGGIYRDVTIENRTRAIRIIV